MTEQLIGNYKVIKTLGAGGEAEVYLAQHKDIANLRGVLKILRDPRMAERFKQQADKLGLLEADPRVCKIKDYFEWQSSYVILMEVIDGVTLEEEITSKGSLPIEESIRITKEILEVLDVAHDRGIAHRDIKPSNVMITSDRRQIKVIDFGIAKSESDPNLTAVGGCCGTPDYMAPEQFSSGEEEDLPRLDIYATGVTLYRMVTGKLPFTGNDLFEIRDAKLFNDPVPPSDHNSEVPAWLEQAILKALERDPLQRYASADQMRDALYSQDQTVATDGLIPAAKKKKRRKHRPQKSAAGRSGGTRTMIFGGVAAVAVIAIAVWVFLMGGEDAGAPLLVSPEAGAELHSGERPVFCWQPIGGETVSYKVEFARSTDFTDVAETQGPWIDTCTITFLSKLDTGTYYWRVLAVERSDGVTPVGDYSAARMFTLAPPTVEPIDGQDVPEDDQIDQTPVIADPEPPAIATCSLAVASRPFRAHVEIDGRLQTQTTPYIFQLNPGQHTVRVYKDADTLQRILQLQGPYLRAMFRLNSGEVTVDQER